MEPISGTRGKVSFNLKWQMLGTAAKHDQSPGGVWEWEGWNDWLLGSAEKLIIECKHNREKDVLFQNKRKVQHFEHTEEVLEH